MKNVIRIVLTDGARPFENDDFFQRLEKISNDGWTTGAIGAVGDRRAIVLLDFKKEFFSKGMMN